MQTSRRVLYLPDELWSRLTAEADRLGCTASFIARETLSARLQPQSPLPDQVRQLSYDLAFDATAPGRGQEARQEQR